MLKDLYLGFKLSVSYFSILPIRFKESDDLTKRDILKFMLLFFPFVGAVLGYLTIFAFGVLDSLHWYGALIAAVLYMWLYGFLHTEAVIDVADAIYASHSSKDVYEIIKEPTVGAMGVLWGVSLLIIKIASIVYLFLTNKALFLVVVAISSRVGLLVLFRVLEFRSKFLQELKASFDRKIFWFSTALYSLILYNIAGLQAVILLLFMVLISFFVAKYIITRLGFANGDVMGTTLEFAEVIGLTGVILCL